MFYYIIIVSTFYFCFIVFILCLIILFFIFIFFIVYFFFFFVFCYLFFFFFFSSRRRHTRSLRDWSSDVCSSDLHIRAMISKPVSLVNYQWATWRLGEHLMWCTFHPGGGKPFEGILLSADHVRDRKSVV